MNDVIFYGAIIVLGTVGIIGVDALVQWSLNRRNRHDGRDCNHRISPCDSKMDEDRK